MPKMNWRERDARELARITEIESKIPELARLLNTSIVRNESNIWIIQLQPFELRLQYDNWQDRIRIFAIFAGLHEFRQYEDADCLITLTPSKTAEKIARDIQARLLPECNSMYQALIDRKNKRTTLLNGREQVAQGIAVHGNGKVYERNIYRPANDESQARFGSAAHGEPHGVAKVTNTEWSGLSISMELRNVPPELANYIASLFGEYGE